MANKFLRMAYGEALRELGAQRKDVFVVDSDLSCVTNTNLFAQEYPERFFNFGIAECNMMGAAAGLALSGKTVFASTFAIFGLGRAFEVVRNAICYTNANVKLALTHGGLTPGEDGGSHQAVEDIALARALPGMTILSPCDIYQTEKAVFAAAEINGPVFLRISRLENGICTSPDDTFVPGKADTLRSGDDVVLIATGLMVQQALKAAELLAGLGINASVINMHTLKPIDKACILRCAQENGKIVTIEEHSVIGGLGSAVAEVLAEGSNARLLRIGIEDVFGRSGKPMDLWRAYGLDVSSITKRIERFVKE